MYELRLAHRAGEKVLMGWFRRGERTTLTVAVALDRSLECRAESEEKERAGKRLEDFGRAERSFLRRHVRVCPWEVGGARIK
jgi:hypothetical protein